jgi:hypothetical protein
MIFKISLVINLLAFMELKKSSITGSSLAAFNSPEIPRGGSVDNPLFSDFKW